MIEGNCINIINLDSMTQSSRAKIYGLQLDFLSKQSNRNSDEIFRVSKTYGGVGRLENRNLFLKVSIFQWKHNIKKHKLF